MRKYILLTAVVFLAFMVCGALVFAGGGQEKVPGRQGAAEAGVEEAAGGEAAGGEAAGTEGGQGFEKVTVEYARGFAVEYYDTYKVVTVYKPWQGAEEDFQYLLVQRGTEVPEGFENAQVVEIPLERIVTMSTTYVTYLEMLDELDSLVGHESFLYTMNDKLLEMAEEGRVKEVGSGPQMNVEIILSLEPDLVMTHAIGSDWDTHPKLFEAGLQVAMNGEHMEQTPLGRFEWMKFVALFFNREDRANEIFRETEQAYHSLAGKVEGKENKPTVLVNSPYQGTWWIPGGNSFQARFIEDAGGDYLWSGDASEGALMLDIESVYEQASDAEIWINPGMWSSLAEATAEDERFTEFDAFQNRKIYNNNRMENENGGNAYWEFGLTEPHIVLADLIAIFHPDVLPDHEFVYYQRLE